MKKIILKIINKIEETKENERIHQENISRMRARKAREDYYSQLLEQRRGIIIENSKEEIRVYIQNLIDKQLKDSQEA